MSKIKIELNDGYSLVVEQSSDPSYPAEVYVGIEKDQCFAQDLAIIQTAAGKDGTSAKATSEHGFNIFVYADEHKEDYTNSFRVNLWKDGCLT